ncbi:hypothetical protein ACQ4PT_041608 [Festuca glaucescens]
MQQSLVVSRVPVHGPCPRLRTGPGSGGHRVLVAEVALGRPANLGKVTAHAYPNSVGQFQGHSSVATLKSCQPPEASTANTANTHNKANSAREDKFFEVEMRVRDDDLDEYGVVNNAIYASYIHDARNIMLQTLGFNVRFWMSTGNSMALSELQLKYFTPLRSGGIFVVKLRVVQIKGVRIIVDHMIESRPSRKLIMEARATAVCLDKNHRPTRVFPDLASKLRQFFSC